jgi:hypothetical protein
VLRRTWLVVICSCDVLITIWLVLTKVCEVDCAVCAVLCRT